MSNSKKLPKNWRWGILFISPWLIGFLLFQLYPLLASFYFSFTDYSVVKSGSFVGLKNYIDLFTQDKFFFKSLKVTFIYAFISVPMKLLFSLFIAMVLNMKLKGINTFRTIYYLPSIMGGSVGIAVLWKFLFIKDGIVNRALAYLHIPPVSWLGDPNIAIITISLLAVWQFGSSMVLFLAALKNVPQELYEASEVDGAGRITKFFKITLPMITPVVFFNIMMQTINALQQFTAAFVITNGGPNRGTYLIGLKIYEDAFSNLKMGYASATSWILFFIILVLTLVLFRSSDAWVYYEDGGLD